ncbi:MAG: hypothetical protein OHK0053_08000 [Microscillaceae bacterium]
MLTFEPKSKKAVQIVTELKNAPFRPWISPRMQWRLARTAFWLLLFGGLGWVGYQNRALLEKSMQKLWTKTQKLPEKEKKRLENILFETGSAQLTAQSKVELDKFAEYLKNEPEIRGEIGGHTDNSGIPAMNQQISELRAKAVYDYLISKGLAADRLRYRGYGDSQPAFPNDSELNRAKNRRIEFKEE